MKAYVVTLEDYYEPSAEIVHHNHAVAARRIGANMLDTDFESVTCRRMPVFDDIEGDIEKINATKIETGWWFECENCYDKVSNDDYAREGKNPEEIVYSGNAVYCNENCRNAWLKSKGEQS